MKPKPNDLKPERRKSVLRRDLNDAVRSDDGRFSESKAWAGVGKLICVYLLLIYTDAVLHTEYTLVTLLAFVIAPDLVKRVIGAKYGSGK